MSTPLYFDTHVHFDGLAGGDSAAAIQRASAAGVTRFLAVGASPESNGTALDVAGLCPERVRAAVGYDRDRASPAPGIEDLDRLLADKRVAAVGEIGLDLHHSPQTAAAQEELFARMLALSRRHGLPVIVHSRDADEPTLRLLREHVGQWHGPPDRLGVLHCFTGGGGFARQLMDLGFLISFSGIVTFRNADPLREVARLVPDDRLLIETDSPYLAPVPCRGQPNEPAFLPYVAAALAQVRRCGVSHIAEVTLRNGEALFWRERAS